MNYLLVYLINLVAVEMIEIVAMAVAVDRMIVDSHIVLVVEMD